MDSDVVNELLSYYGMPVLNPYKDERDMILIDIAIESADLENPNERFSMPQINERLLDSGHPELDLKERRNVFLN